MRKLVTGALVLVCALTFGASQAAAAPINVIGQFSWDDSGLGLGPTFTFENTSLDSLENLSVYLDTDDAAERFKSYSFFGSIPSGMSQTIDDLIGFDILFASIRLGDPSFVLTLFDAFDAPLVDGLGAPGDTAQVDLSAAPIPEPGTLLLLGSGLAGAFVRRRRARAKC